MLEFSVLIRPAPDVPGQWVAHCLNWDVVTQGSSPEHAARMVGEAVLLTIDSDLEDGFDPGKRPVAPPELWQLFQHTQRTGTRIAHGDIDTVRHRVIAGVMYLRQVSGHARDEVDSPFRGAPPPFMIAALEREDGNRNHHV